MRRALVLARRNLRTHPNPRVGAVVVRNGEIVGEGWHNGPGTPHAEAAAFAQAGERARGATIYVTLEPCSHTHNPDGSPRVPCAQRCLDAGVARVVGAMVDPDVRTSGRGFEQLRQEGVAVTIGVEEEAARRLNEAFIRHRKTGLPFITHKAAMTLDGKIATTTGDSKWITGEASRAYVHEHLRGDADAIVAGVGTVLKDNPQFTVRSTKSGRATRAGNAKPPLRVLIDSSLRTPHDFHVAGPNSLFICADGIALRSDAERLREAGAEVVFLPIGDGEDKGRVSVRAVAELLAARGLLSVLLESGGALAASFWQAGLVNRVVFFYAPKIVGGVYAPTAIDGPGITEMANAHNLGTLKVRRFGSDIAIFADVPENYSGDAAAQTE